MAGAAVADIRAPKTPSGVAATQTDQAHPRLLFSETEIPALRAKVTNSPNDYDDADFLRLKNRASSLLNLSAGSVVAGGATNYGLYNIPALGMAYRLAPDGDPKKAAYQQKCKDALTYLAQNYGPVANDAHYSSMRLFVLAIGFDLCFDTIAIPPTDPAYPVDRKAIVDKMVTYLDPAIEARFDWKSREFPPYTSNGSVLVGSASGLASIVLRGETANTAWLESALAWAERVVEADLNSIFDPDGGANEGELYGPFALRFLVPYVEARQRYDGLDLGQRPELVNFDRWIAYAVLPNGFLTQANDGNYSEIGLLWNNTYTNWCQTRYQSQLGRWVFEQIDLRFLQSMQRDWMACVLWNQGSPTAPPAEFLADSYLARRRGFYYYRTGFTPTVPGELTDTVFSFYAGRFGGGHAQEDQGTFSLFADARWYLPDYGYSRAPYLDTKQSEAHNLVFIDGRGEHNAGNCIGTDGSIPASNLGAFTDYLQADLQAAYSTHSPLNDPNVPWAGTDWSWGYENPPNTVQRADRHVLVVKRSAEAPEYFLIVDDIVKDGLPHTYDWTWHTDLESSVDVTTNPVSITPPGYGSRKLSLYFASPAFSSLSLSSAIYARHASDPDTRRIKATVTNVVDPYFFVSIIPVVSPGAAPSLAMLPEVTGGIGERLTWPTATDEICFRKESPTVTAGTLTSDAELILVRRRASGEIAKFTMAQGTSLRVGSTSLASVLGGPRGTVTSDGTTVGVSDPGLRYVIWGPSVTGVTSNRQPVSFVREGGYVYVNRPVPVPIPADSVLVAILAPTSVKISWPTGFPGDSQVLYGGSTSYGLASPRDPCLTTSHAVTLAGLCLGKTYHFCVTSQNDENRAISDDSTFDTFDLTPSPDDSQAVSDLEPENSAYHAGSRTVSRGGTRGAPRIDPPAGGATDREEGSGSAPLGCGVWPQPNPARRSVSLLLPDLPDGPGGRLTVFDVAGRRVRDFDVELAGGSRRLLWDGKDEGGREVSPGVYFVKLAIGDRIFTSRFTLLE